MKLVPSALPYLATATLFYLNLTGHQVIESHLCLWCWCGAGGRGAVWRL